jgi:hypothetical protein
MWGTGTTGRHLLMRRGERVSVRKDWLISCSDAAGRRRDIILFTDEGQVVMIAPPGETAVLAPLEVGRLRAALRDAIVDASEE